MTEGPEATYLAHYIATYFKNKRLKKVTIRDGRYKHHGPPKNMKRFQKALPMKLLDVYKKGKVIFFLFEHNWCMIAKMGMVGWFSKTDAHANVIFHFENTDLYFSDFRNFGTLTFTDDPLLIMAEIDAIAPDILDDHTTWASFSHHLHAHPPLNTSLELFLMEQGQFLSGIGNIIKSEILYDARLAPHRTVESMKKEEWHRLFTSAKKISKKIQHHLEKHGWDDSYFQLHTIYQKEKDPHGFTVKTRKAKDGRTTFWVPELQK